MSRDPAATDDDKSLLDNVEEALIGTHQADPNDGKDEPGDLDNIDTHHANPLLRRGAKLETLPGHGEGRRPLPGPPAFVVV
jgi:hypothetical protein